MLVNILDKNGYTIVDVKEKRIDAAIDNEFKKTLIDVIAKANNIVIDFSSVDFVDSSLLSVLIYIYKICQRENKKLYIVGLSKKLWTLFDITGLTSIFPIFNNINECTAQVKT
jgi:anti-sigma B factor antagonist